MEAAEDTRKAEWITLNQAAKALGVGPHTVLALAVKGDLVAQHIAGRTVVSAESVEKYLAAQPAA